MKKQMQVYFVQAGCQGAIKIGKTTCLKNRLHTLSTSSAEKLRVLAVIPESEDMTEKKLHARFKEFRKSGEWFRPTLELRTFIARLPNVNIEALHLPQFALWSIDDRLKLKNFIFQQAMKIKKEYDIWDKDINTRAAAGEAFSHYQVEKTFKGYRGEIQNLLGMEWRDADYYITNRNNRSDDEIKIRTLELIDKVMDAERNVWFWNDDLKTFINQIRNTYEN